MCVGTPVFVSSASQVKELMDYQSQSQQMHVQANQRPCQHICCCSLVESESLSSGSCVYKPEHLLCEWSEHTHTLQTNTQAHTHTRTHAHTHTHTHTHTLQTHAHTRTHTRTHTHMETHTCEQYEGRISLACFISTSVREFYSR